jgi:hypothetical protein
MTFRRAGPSLLPWYLYLALLWSCAALFTLAFVLAIFLRDPWTGERVLTVIMIGRARCRHDPHRAPGFAASARTI